MKALIVDDEPLARRELRRLLTDVSWVEVCGEAANIMDAQREIEALAPDLLLLDIHMPGGSGFDLLERLERVPQVIFTTAYDQHAVRAFDVNALDYLLKPIVPERLHAALNKLRSPTGLPSPPVSPGEPLDQLFVRDGPRCWFVPLREVSLLHAEGNYVRLLWGKRRPMLGRPLVALEQRLDRKFFFRANRSEIINLGFVEAIEPGINGRLHVQLRDGPEIEMSRRQARLFREQTSV